MVAIGLLGDKQYHAFEFILRRLLAYRAMPLLLHPGRAHDIDKLNGKPGPAGRRLVWALDRLGKGLYRLL